jgi:pilus assembly protein FimV
VRKSDVKNGLLALLIALLPSVAGAAGLGRITVLTAIGQPLVAEIDLVAVTQQEMASLSARLSLPDAYRQANLQYNVALTGARVTIEKRPSGQPYIKIVTPRAVTEPFIDLLVELTWSAGRLSREYTALLDPPGIPPLTAAPVTPTAPAVAPAPVTAPTPAPEPAPKPAAAAEPPAPAAPIAAAPVTAAPAPALAEPVAPAPVAAAPAPAAPPVVPSPVVPAPIAATPLTSSNEYGPVERGETLGKIAQNVMPEGVTLEQMLVALYRSNPDAFIRNNLNLVRAGKILRVPNRDEVETMVARDDAVAEYRTHVADWNAYRQKLAETAGAVPAEKRVATSGKITPKVEEKAAPGEPKDVVRLSKGEPTGAAADKGKPRSTADRVRMLEEEAVARERALAEANSRIAQLEKTIQDMKKLAELKSPGMATAQQQAQKPAAPAPVAKPAAPAPAAQPEPAKPEVVAAAKPAPAAAPAQKPAPAVQPRPKPAPMPPQPEPDLMDEIMAAASNPLYLGAGGALVLGGLAFWMVRRRRVGVGRSDSPPIAPKLGMAAAAAAGAAAVTGDTAAAESAAREPSGGSADDVDPLQEADVYIQYGRDGQAEEILKEALARNPNREDVQLKLLEIYAGRKDKDAFGKVAADLNRVSGGAGPNWLKAAAMGYGLDAANPLYEAGKGAETATVVRGVGTASDVDLDLGGSDLPRVSTDIMLDAGAVEAASGVDTTIQVPEVSAPVEQGLPTASVPDFTLEVPAAGAVAQTDVALEPGAPARDSNVIDFHIELPKVAEPATVVSTPVAASEADGGIDFKLEGLDLNLESEPKTLPSTASASAEKDGQWYDVQTKFDLAKAYQEMGDRNGAREILQEVIKEGDAEQRSQASKLLESLG